MGGEGGWSGLMSPAVVCLLPPSSARLGSMDWHLPGHQNIPHTSLLPRILEQQIFNKHLVDVREVGALYPGRPVY